MKEQIVRAVCVLVGICLGVIFGSWLYTAKPTPDATTNPSIISTITNLAATPPAEVQPCPSERAPAAAKPVYLGAPNFRQSSFTSDRDGKVYVTWKASEGAEKYEVKVFDTKGTAVKTFVSERTVASLDGLAVDPKASRTMYKVQVTPLGPNAKRGIASEKKDVSMLPMRNLAPPSIKSITTEED